MGCRAGWGWGVLPVFLGVTSRTEVPKGLFKQSAKGRPAPHSPEAARAPEAARPEPEPQPLLCCLSSGEPVSRSEPWEQCLGWVCLSPSTSGHPPRSPGRETEQDQQGPCPQGASCRETRKWGRPHRQDSHGLPVVRRGGWAGAPGPVPAQPSLLPRAASGKASQQLWFGLRRQSPSCWEREPPVSQVLVAEWVQGLQQWGDSPGREARRQRQAGPQPMHVT